MSTIKIILAADPDGTVHLPLPPDLRHGTLKITATIEAVNPAENAQDNNLRGFGCLKGKIHLAPDFDAPLDDFKDYMK